MPDLNLFSIDIAPVAQATGTGTTVPTDAPAEVEGSSMTFVVIGIAVVLFIALLLVAIRSFRPASTAADAPRRTGPDDVARPTRGLLADRDVVEEQSEITADDSLSSVKKKKRERVKKSYAEARKELQARKADTVTQEQQRKIQEAPTGSEEEGVATAGGADAPTVESGDAAATQDGDSEAGEDSDSVDQAVAAGSEADEDADKAPEPEAVAEAQSAAPDAEDAKDSAPALGFLDEINAGWEDLDDGELSLSLAGLEAEAAVQIPEAAEVSPPEQESVDADGDDAQVDVAQTEEGPVGEGRADQVLADEGQQGDSRADDEAPAEEAPAEDSKADVLAGEAAGEAQREPAAQEEATEEVASAATPVAAAEEPEVNETAEPPGKQAKALSAGLEKTRGGFVSRLGSLFKRKNEIDSELLDELEEVLYTSDMGPKSVEALLARVQTELDAAEISDPARVWQFIRDETHQILSARQRSLEIPDGVRPFVVLVVGVNGVGKTTTIGKLAMRFTDAGHKTLMVAGDTFRAAATEQLEEWGERTGLAVHTGDDKEDPASVVFSGIQRAADEGFDVVLCDTAGRLTNKKNLMKELEKIGRVAAKACEGAPHETLLVLDANTGMMAVHQARMFQEVVDISGIVLTKLDGTAKGGVILGISEELQVPVQYIGIGEGVYDLRPFDAKEFVDALFM